MAERTEKSSEARTHRGSEPQSAEPGKGATQDEIVTDIEETREQLRETVDSLSAKLDVKANTKARVEEAKKSATAKLAEAKRGVQDTYEHAMNSEPARRARNTPAIPVGTLVAVVVLGVGVVAWRRRDTRPQPVKTLSKAASRGMGSR